jgi:hypothetical protein
LGPGAQLAKRNRTKSKSINPFIAIIRPPLNIYYH